MGREHREPEIVGSYGSEFEATLMQNQLRDAGIPCELVGVHTAGFRAEAPGMVKLMVPAGMGDRARDLLGQMETDFEEFLDDESDDEGFEGGDQ